MGRGRADYYQRLGVRPAATGAEIRAAFLDLAKRHHPDRASDADRPAAEVTFRELSQAYETLSDPSRRADYDARRRLEQVWHPPEATGGLWRIPGAMAARWGVERIPWYGWLVVGPFLLGVMAAVVIQFFFYYVFVYGIAVLVPLLAAYYAYLLWPPLAVVVLVPSIWLWGFLVQGTYRNWRAEREMAHRRAQREVGMF
ncbi:MAG TPA: J domain-containing protein [bacterium]|nr:J domain-containing protein [bacterium]